jgi:hypothetical protein
MREFRGYDPPHDNDVPMVYDIDMVNCAPNIMMQWAELRKKKRNCQSRHRHFSHPTVHRQSRRLITEMIENKWYSYTFHAKTKVLAVTYGQIVEDDNTPWLKQYWWPDQCAAVAGRE